MSNGATSFRPNAVEFGRVFTVPFSSPKADTYFKETSMSLYTTDGSLVAFISEADAVNAGAGIFFGGYLVGATDDSNMPFIKY